MSIFKSRKFWIVVSDAVVSITTMAVTLYLSQDLETRAFVLGIIAALQSVVKALIDGIAEEDSAKITAFGSVEAALAAEKKAS